MAKHPYEMPQEVVREAVVNALVHKQYTLLSKFNDQLYSCEILRDKQK